MIPPTVSHSVLSSKQSHSDNMEVETKQHEVDTTRFLSPLNSRDDSLVMEIPDNTWTYGPGVVHLGKNSRSDVPSAAKREKIISTNVNNVPPGGYIF